MDLNDYSTESTVKLPLWMRATFKLHEMLSRRTLRKDGTINRRLSDLLEFKASARPLPRRPGAWSSKDVTLNPDTNLWARIYTPPHDPHATEKQSMPIVFYFHGGGFAILSADMVFYDSFCRRLSKACKVVVISVNYRRSPEHRYPAAYEDCFAALKWAATEPAYTHHIPPVANRHACFLMGDSAGGNIVHHVACMAASEQDVSSLSPLCIKGSFLLFPFFGGEERTPAELRMGRAPIATLEECDWYWRAYLPVGASRDHHASNVLGPQEPDFTKLGLPPCMVVVAEHDFLKDRQVKYVEKLMESGKEVQLEYYKGGIHAFHVFKNLLDATDLMSKLDKFIKDLQNLECTK